jgi:aspartate 1-decarboxylase
MFRILLRSKIRRVALTHCELTCEGSCAIDKGPLAAANIAATPVHADPPGLAPRR